MSYRQSRILRDIKEKTLKFARFRAYRVEGARGGQVGVDRSQKNKERPSSRPGGTRSTRTLGLAKSAPINSLRFIYLSNGLVDTTAT